MHISFIMRIISRTRERTYVCTLSGPCLSDEFNDCTHTGCANSLDTMPGECWKTRLSNIHYEQFSGLRKYPKHTLVMSHFIIVNPFDKKSHFAYVTESI